MTKDKLLDIEDLVVRFYTYQGVVQALEGVNLEVGAGETFGLVGETGCGKTLTALSVLVLVPAPGKIERGSIIFRSRGEAVDLLEQRENRLGNIRGREISMIFQEPAAALNPVYPIREQVAEVFLLHRQQELAQRALKEVERALAGETTGVALLARPLRWLERLIYQEMRGKPQSLWLRLLSRLPLVRRLLGRLRHEANKMSIELLRQMEIPDPERVARGYPHELSGGMKQRVVAAMALACNPSLLIADEPTTSLDVTIQAQILELLRRLKEERGASLLLITHNLGIVAEMCDRVGVMYAGSLCEVAEVKELFANPLHPYTKALMRVIPRPGAELSSIPGTVPDLIQPPPGCRFHPRCRHAMAVCQLEPPPLKKVAPGHQVACYLY